MAGRFVSRPSDRAADPWGDRALSEVPADDYARSRLLLARARAFERGIEPAVEWRPWGDMPRDAGLARAGARRAPCTDCARAEAAAAELRRETERLRAELEGARADLTKTRAQLAAARAELADACLVWDRAGG